MSEKMSLNKLTNYLSLEYGINFSQGSGIKRSYWYQNIEIKNGVKSREYTDKDAQIVAKVYLMKRIFRLIPTQTEKKQNSELDKKINRFAEHNSEEALRSILNEELFFDMRSTYLTRILDSCKKYNRSLSQINWGLLHSELVLQKTRIKNGQEDKDESYYMQFMDELVKRPYPDHLNEQLIGIPKNILMSIMFADNCDPFFMDWLLDDQDDKNLYAVRLKSEYSNEVIDSLKEDYRNGIPVEKYVDMYYEYMEKNYIKIHDCAAYLRNEYADRLDLWVSNQPAIKKIATEMFGLEQPNFEL